MTCRPTLSALSPSTAATLALRRAAPDLQRGGLIRTRVRVEVAWLQALAKHSGIAELKGLAARDLEVLQEIVARFSTTDASEVKQLERETNHDVKAVEYFLKRRLVALEGWAGRVEFVHFACTSEDINNLAYALMCQEARDRVLLPRIQALVESLRAMAHAHADDAMVSRTHGQPATPTTLGKEIAVFVHRLRQQAGGFAAVPIRGKFNGAVGNYNAHVVAYPEPDWPLTARLFVESLGLVHSPYTTQIEPHDWIAEYCDALARTCSVLLDLCRDFWGYVSLGYFRQKVVAGEIGSSTMPHKVNPIDFENAEGNLGLAGALLRFMSEKLPVSRWQRDLSDSTVLRNLGVALAHADIAVQSIGRGLSRLDVDTGRMAADLEGNWELLAEPIQTVMRRYGIAGSYEDLKALTRGRSVDARTIADFIAGLPIPDEARRRLTELSPARYIGLAARLARDV
jgi:adenylosuccinate lyase